MNPNSLIIAASFTPNSLQWPNAWVGHLPFAAWLIQEVRPKIFVELGTHTGNSYFSFCQSVAEADISTKCYAVDTWQGDEHASLYDDDIFTTVSMYHQEHYASFSRLLRMTFDEAVSHFSDESIDLLHIDGLHTYEAVCHDFETWLPKLAPGAVILFHDTNVRERNFGVWKLWEELQVHYPNNLEFVHSHGLGVLQLNNAPDEHKLEWLQPNNPEKHLLFNYFAALGLRQLGRYEINEQKQHIVSLNQTISERNEQIAIFNQVISERDEHINTLNKTLNKTIAEYTAQNASLKQTIAKLDSTINALLSSTSWRLTKPLRWVGVQVIRGKLVLKSLALANTHTGNIRKTLIKLFEVYKREGVQGVKSRIRFLLTTNAPQLSTWNILESDISDYPFPFDNRNKEVIQHSQSVDVIVCVHNALDDVERCLESVIRNTDTPYHIIIVDDGSAQATKEYLEKFVVDKPITLIRNDIATGYTKAANTGMRASNSDFVVLLNSDTIVPPQWLDRLVQCANSSEKIGMTGPLSNTASWQSVPQIVNDKGDWADNPLPENWSVNDFAHEVARVSARTYPRVGFLNGFCLLIKRELIEDIGLFDEETFARGYGEENDYALRTTENGWQLAIADDCYVYHAQSKSYSHERRKELARLAGEALANKHGQTLIDHNLSMTQAHPVLLYMRQRCSEIKEMSALRSEVQLHFAGKRVLFLLPVTSACGGGNIVLLEAECMRAMGVDVWIANLESNRFLFEKNHPDIQVPALYLKTSEDLMKIAVDFDAVIATLYLTVFWMNPLRKLDRCPALGYYIQDFEPDFFTVGSVDYQIALTSYTVIPELRLFTKTNWNQQVLIDKAGVLASVIGPSLDVDRFHPSPIVHAHTQIINILAMVRPSSPRRGPEMTMRVLNRLVQRFGKRIRVTIFGVNPNDAEFLTYPHNFEYRNLGEINTQRVAVALSNTDIFIDCSIFQAMGLTAMEAMASGVAVVGPINGGLKEIINDGYNGILVDTQHEDSIFAAVVKLITDNELRTKIQSNALEVLMHSPVYSSFKILNCLFPQNKQSSTLE